MRLAFCNATRRWGGVKTWSVEFASALTDLGHEVFLYGRDPVFIERARAAGLAARRVDFGCDFNPAAIAFFYREFRQRGVEAVLVNVGKDLRTAGVAARLRGLALVQRVGLPGDMRDDCTVRLTNRLLRPHYLCPCRYIRDGLLRRVPFLDAGDCSVLYSAKQPLPEPPSGRQEPPALLSSSQVNANKGHAELARVLAALHREGFRFTWHIAGVGDYLDDLRRLCASLGLAGSVRFHGFVRDMGALLRLADVFVLSSYTEGLPNTLLEAMAHGLAPVARAVGGVPECWPDLPALLAPFDGWERDADWAARPARDSPLYAPIRLVLGASDEDIGLWKHTAWRHCRDHFSLPTQAGKLASFFAERIAAQRP